MWKTALGRGVSCRLNKDLSVRYTVEDIPDGVQYGDSVIPVLGMDETAAGFSFTMRTVAQTGKCDPVSEDGVTGFIFKQTRQNEVSARKCRETPFCV